jgi:outer membrane protein, heavy metal efflux system
MNRSRSLGRLMPMFAVLTLWSSGARAEGEQKAPQLDVVSPTDLSLTLSDVLKQLRDRSPRAAVARAGVNVAAADRVAASLYPNPTLSYDATIGIHRPDYVNGTQHQVTFSQPFLVSGQRGARERAAEQGVAAARAELTAFQHARAGEARKLFVGLVAAQARRIARGVFGLAAGASGG